MPSPSVSTLNQILSKNLNQINDQIKKKSSNGLSFEYCLVTFLAFFYSSTKPILPLFQCLLDGRLKDLYLDRLICSLFQMKVTFLVMFNFKTSFSPERVEKLLVDGLDQPLLLTLRPARPHLLPATLLSSRQY